MARSKVYPLFLKVFIPMARVVLDQESGKERREPMPSNPRVLLVDDDPDISLALSDYLHKEGYDVEVVETGNAAIHKSTKQSYDVVILDVGLPDRDGIEVLGELAERNPHLPIVLLTAFTSLQQTTPPDKLNKAFAYLSKPYSRQEMKEVLYRSVIRSRETAKEAKAGVSSQSVPYKPTFHFPSILQPIQAKEREGTAHDGQLTLEEYQRLAEDVQLRQFAFDHIPEAILVADADKHIRFANQTAVQALGYTKEWLETLRIPDIAPNHDNQRYQAHLKELREGKTLSYYTMHHTKLGQEIPVTISVYLFNFQGKEFTCAITKPSKKTDESPRESEDNPTLRWGENV
jgi:PAS domain S-box-containing protein